MGPGNEGRLLLNGDIVLLRNYGLYGHNRLCGLLNGGRLDFQRRLCIRGLLDGSQSQLLKSKFGNVHTHHRIHIGAGMAVGVKNKTIPLLYADFQNDVVEFLLHLGHEVFFGLFQEFHHLHAEVHSVVHEVLQLGLTLLHDGLGKVFLSLEKFHELSLEILLAAQGFLLIFLFEKVKVLLSLGIFRHLLHHLLVAEITKLYLSHDCHGQHHE